MNLLLIGEWLAENSFLLPNWAWLAIAAVIIVLAVFIIVFALRGKRKKKTAEEPVSEVKTEEPAKERETKKPAPAEEIKEEKPAAKSAPRTAAKKPAAKPVEKAKDDGKVYHISRRKDENKWQIKAEGGAKAIKLFNTQAEAIEYAKTLADNQDARIMIHKADGSFRRLDYKN